ncbi:MAG: hypothetical protein AAF851_09285 [Myxococcota bacterium]
MEAILRANPTLAAGWPPSEAQLWLPIVPQGLRESRSARGSGARVLLDEKERGEFLRLAGEGEVLLELARKEDFPSATVRQEILMALTTFESNVEGLRGIVLHRTLPLGPGFLESSAREIRAVKTTLEQAWVSQRSMAAVSETLTIVNAHMSERLEAYRQDLGPISSMLRAFFASTTEVTATIVGRPDSGPHIYIAYLPTLYEGARKPKSFPRLATPSSSLELPRYYHVFWGALKPDGSQRVTDKRELMIQGNEVSFDLPWTGHQ